MVWYVEGVVVLLVVFVVLVFPEFFEVEGLSLDVGEGAVWLGLISHLTII